jgi:hypothetical protein
VPSSCSPRADGHHPDGCGRPGLLGRYLPHPAVLRLLQVLQREGR